MKRQDMCAKLTPPSVLPDISPSRGEIDARTVCQSSLTSTQGMGAFCAGIIEGCRTALQPISPRVGEMSGRTEGGIETARAGTKRIATVARLGAMLMLLLAPIPAFAVNPDEVLADPALEQRARTLSSELRCMVCQNQSIDDSNAELARDLRLVVRERLVNGDSDEQVLDYVVSRYGEFVLLKPRLSAKTLILWGAPAALAIVALIVAVFYARRRANDRDPAEKLSAEEEARLGRLMDGE